MDLSRYTEEQRNVILDDSKNILVIACSGAGKSSTMVGKIEKFVEDGMDPKRILVSTFTNKAANDIKTKILGKLNSMGKVANVLDLWVGTIHSTCRKILRKYAKVLGYGLDYDIADPVKQLRIMEEVVKIKQILKADSDMCKLYLQQISRIKNLPDPDKELERIKSKGNVIILRDTTLTHFVDVFRKYHELMFNENSMDFDDLLINTAKVLQLPDVLKSVQSWFDAVVIDEYQDVNHSQATIFRLIADSPNTKYIVVGDDDQAIYGFRGSNRDYIMKHKDILPNCSVHYLSINFRCARNIVELAEQVILPSNGRNEKSLKAHKEQFQEIVLERFIDEEEEAFFVSNKIYELKKEDPSLDFNRIAVLARTQRQSRFIEQSFIINRIPYKVVGGFNFYDRSEVKDTLMVIKLLAGEFKRDNVYKFLKLFAKGVGDVAIGKIFEHNPDDIFDTLKHIERVRGLSVKQKSTIKGLYNDLVYYRFKDIKSGKDISKNVLDFFKKVNYVENVFKTDSTEQKFQRFGNIHEILKALIEVIDTSGKTLSEFYDLVREFQEVKEDKYGITVMTMHASKGLEYDTVFIIGAQEGIIPHNYSEQIDEERRLFYVAITRAEKRLYLSINSPKESRFLEFEGKEKYYTSNHNWMPVADSPIVRTVDKKIKTDYNGLNMVLKNMGLK